jgi:TonB family protein
VPAKPTPTPVPRTQPAPQITAAAPAETAAPNAAVGTDAPQTQPVFGVTMESTSTGGTTTAKVGNSTAPQPGGTTSDGGPAKQLAPAAAAEVTRMPLPQGACSGKYTDDARAAGIEGTVVLDLVVDETGRAREITVVSGLDHGLTEAAVAALKACRFSPGERSGQRVPVRVRGFKIRFVMADQ